MEEMNLRGANFFFPHRYCGGEGMGGTEKNRMGSDTERPSQQKWGRAQEMYYHHNAIIWDNKTYSKQSWTRKTIESFYDNVLGLWNERCDALHGATAKENNEKRKQKIQ